MTTFKEYAELHGVSADAIRLQIKRNAERFEGHIHKVNRTNYIDDEGVQILDEIRNGSTVVVINESKDDEIQKLRERNDILTGKVISLEEKIHAILEENQKAIEEKNNAYNVLALEDKNRETELRDKYEGLILEANRKYDELNAKYIELLEKQTKPQEEPTEEDAQEEAVQQQTAVEPLKQTLGDRLKRFFGRKGKS